jgi:hypothetical protein
VTDALLGIQHQQSVGHGVWLTREPGCRSPRGIEIRGTAELHHEGGEQIFGGGGWDSAWFAVRPQRIISWGIEGPAFSATGRSARSVPAS